MEQHLSVQLLDPMPILDLGGWPPPHRFHPCAQALASQVGFRRQPTVDIWHPIPPGTSPPAERALEGTSAWALPLVHARMPVGTRACTQAYTHTLAHAETHSSTRVRKRAIGAYRQTRKQVDTQTHIHTSTHTHIAHYTQARRWAHTPSPGVAGWSLFALRPRRPPGALRGGGVAISSRIRTQCCAVPGCYARRPRPSPLVPRPSPLAPAPEGMPVLVQLPPVTPTPRSE